MDVDYSVPGSATAALLAAESDGCRAAPIRILGPVEAGPVPIPRRQVRAVLGILLLQPGAVVLVDRLIDLIWDGAPPKNARHALHGCVARARAALTRAGAVTVSHRDGYAAHLDPALVDAHRFRTLVGRADAVADPAERYCRYGQALALWRGPALHNALGDHARYQLCAELETLRILALENRCDAGLRLGLFERVGADLAGLTAEHPTNERLAALAMRAQHLAGHPAEALRTYHRLRSALADELGLDPGPTAQSLYLSLIRGEL